VQNLMARSELARQRFERLYRDHAREVYAYLRWWCGHDTTAEDLLADVFERVLRSGHRYDPKKGSETTWLYAIAINRVRDHARRGAAERRAVERLRTEVVASVPASPGGDERIDLPDALSRLSDEEREVVALRFGADLSVVGIAEALGEPLTTVEGRLYRALRKLREATDAQRRNRVDARS
jgi:RNA polymerase sigma factor (sigma-70 family)